MTRTEDQPLYTQISTSFLQQVREGRLLPGDRLPTELEIMDQFKVSRGTVTRALRDLELRGILLRRRGLGTFVTDAKEAVAERTEQLSIAMFVPCTVLGQGLGTFQTEMHHAISTICSEHNIQLSLQFIPAKGKSRRDKVISATKTLIEQKPRLVLYYALELPPEELSLNQEVIDLLNKAGVGVILLDRDVTAYPDRSQSTLISFDNRGSTIKLVRHMVEAGYEKIAYLGSSRGESTASNDRFAGYCEGLRNFGMPIVPELIFKKEPWPEEEDCREILKRDFDAIICKDSGFATSLGFAIRESGRRLGRDVGLAGFDDFPLAAMLPVPLTIVRQPVKPFAEAVYRCILANTRHRPGSPESCAGSHIVIASELIARGSTSRQR